MRHQGTPSFECDLYTMQSHLIMRIYLFVCGYSFPVSKLFQSLARRLGCSWSCTLVSSSTPHFIRNGIGHYEKGSVVEKIPIFA